MQQYTHASISDEVGTHTKTLTSVGVFLWADGAQFQRQCRFTNCCDSVASICWEIVSTLSRLFRYHPAAGLAGAFPMNTSFVLKNTEVVFDTGQFYIA